MPKEKTPDRTKMQKNISKGLDRAFDRIEATRLELNSDQAKFVIFSDHHRGTGDGADDFCRCSKAYSAALGYYLESGYTLVLLGDAEDLWECRPNAVIGEYRNTLLLEAAFLRDKRYYRIYGNHDDLWRDPRVITRHFQSHMPGHPEIKTTESMHLQLNAPAGRIYRFFLVHGHQGTLDSDRFGRLSRLAVRYLWRPFQRLTGFKSTTPSKDEELRGAHDIAMYGWAAGKNGRNGEVSLVLIAGHTHLPVFSSATLVGSLQQQLEKLQQEYDGIAIEGSVKQDKRHEIAEKRAELEFYRTASGRTGASGGKPCYFNTGCCSFGDGDVTGIELEGGKIKLVRWPDDEGRPKAKVLQSVDMHAVFR